MLILNKYSETKLSIMKSFATYNPLSLWFVAHLCYFQLIDSICYCLDGSIKEPVFTTANINEPQHGGSSSSPPEVVCMSVCGILTTKLTAILYCV